MKICFHSCRYQNQNFSLVSYLCRSCSNRVPLLSHSCHTRVACIALVPLLCGIRVVRYIRPHICVVITVSFNTKDKVKIQYLHLASTIQSIDYPNEVTASFINFFCSIRGRLTELRWGMLDDKKLDKFFVKGLNEERFSRFNCMALLMI